MVLVKEITKNERPREKALKFGIAVLSNRELLALILRSGYEKHSVLDIADQLLKQYQSLAKILTLDIEELMEFKGIKEAKALELVACCELSKRMMLENTLNKDIIISPYGLLEWLKLNFGFLHQEEFIVIFLNTKNYILDYQIIAKGGLDSASVAPREVFKRGIKLSCAKIICVHNHPSLDITPSTADIEVTKRLEEAGRFLGIPLLDHIIIGGNNHYSFRDNKLLEP